MNNSAMIDFMRSYINDFVSRCPPAQKIIKCLYDIYDYNTEVVVYFSDVSLADAWDIKLGFGFVAKLNKTIKEYGIVDETLDFDKVQDQEISYYLEPGWEANCNSLCDEYADVIREHEGKISLLLQSAIAYVFCHELAHFYYKYDKPKVEEAHNKRVNEWVADMTAFKWLNDWEMAEPLRAIKAQGILVGLATTLEGEEDGYHPRAILRMDEYLRTVSVADKEPLYELACKMVASKLQCKCETGGNHKQRFAKMLIPMDDMEKEDYKIAKRMVKTDNI